jgi:hypothetical protein
LSGAVIAPSGKTKTPTWKTFVNLVVEKEKDWRNEHQKLTAKYLEEKEAWDELQKRNKETEKKTGVAQNTPPAPVEPVPCRRLMLNDATPEKMHDVMRTNPEGLFYYRDELSSWVAELDKEGREVQRGLFLAAMNGDDAYSIDRIGREGGFATMCCSVFGGLPSVVLDALNAIQREGKYFFWSGSSKPKSAVGDFQRSLRTLFDLAGMPHIHAHLFRHTYATELLTAGTSIETVAALMGHSSTKVTEKSYSHWVKGRQESLEAAVKNAWTHLDPLAP